MRRRLMLAHLLVFVLLLVRAPIHAEERDTIIWMEAMMPPFLIQNDGNKGEGYGDVISAILQEGLPEYDHRKMVANVSRHFYRFKQGEKVCSVGLYPTPERAQFMYFSIPSFLTLPAVLIIKKESWPRFGNQRTIRLADVLQNEQLRIGTGKDRSFGEDTDAVLKQYGQQPRLIVTSGPELSLSLFKMMLQGRLDGILGLPEEALYQAEQLGIRDQLMTLTITENAHGYDSWLSSVGCTKSAWGKAVIDKINAVLLRQRPTERYRAAYERWLDPNAIAAYRKVYDQVFVATKPKAAAAP